MDVPLYGNTWNVPGLCHQNAQRPESVTITKTGIAAVPQIEFDRFYSILFFAPQFAHQNAFGIGHPDHLVSVLGHVLLLSGFHQGIATAQQRDSQAHPQELCPICPCGACLLTDGRQTIAQMVSTGHWLLGNELWTGHGLHPRAHQAIGQHRTDGHHVRCLVHALCAQRQC